MARGFEISDLRFQISDFKFETADVNHVRRVDADAETGDQLRRVAAAAAQRGVQVRVPRRPGVADAAAEVLSRRPRPGTPRGTAAGGAGRRRDAAAAGG